MAVKKKRCPQCGKTKPIGAFGVHSGRKDGRQSTCKVCKRGLDHQLYLRDPQKYVARNLAHRDRIKKLIAEYLQTHPCVDCGGADIVVLEFDHVGDDKTCDISQMIGRGLGWPTILKEIAKCEVVCAERPPPPDRPARRSLSMVTGGIGRPAGL